MSVERVLEEYMDSIRKIDKVAEQLGEELNRIRDIVIRADTFMKALEKVLVTSKIPRALLVSILEKIKTDILLEQFFEEHAKLFLEQGNYGVI